MRKRSRITITLPSDILKKVDKLVDGKTLHNRSHAIEELLRDSLQPTISTAVILAGGSELKSKGPLKKINEQYLLSLTLEQLKKFGMEKVIICTSEEVKRLLQVRFGDGSDLDLELAYVTESRPLGTAGAIKNADYLLGNHPFCVVHGDILTDLNLHEFFEFHVREGSVATIGVQPAMGDKKYGRVYLQGNKITRFLSHGSNEGINIINTGIYILEPEILKLIPRGTPFFLETDIFPKLADRGSLSAFIFQGSWYDTSNRESLEKAMKEWV